MSQITKLVPLKKARKKYEQFRDLNNGTCEVIVDLLPDGSEDPSSWSPAYREQLQRILTSKKSGKRKRKGSKWYFGMGAWNPLRWILWIIYLPFRIVWKILKTLGLGFISDWIGGGASDLISEGADYISDFADISDITEAFDFDMLDVDFLDGGEIDVEVFEDMENFIDENPELVDKKQLKNIKKLLDKKKKKNKKKKD